MAALKNSKAKDWAVYIKPNGEWDAVVLTHGSDQVQELHDECNTIMGFVFFEFKDHAIQYLQDCRWKGKK